jgi:hypothetical protein
MIKIFLGFKLKLSLALIISFAIHYMAIKPYLTPVFLDLFTTSYFGNFVITGVVFFVIILLQKTQAKKLGFVFLFTSLFKFAFFYFLLYPSFMSDLVVSKLEFFSFFIPYSVSLTLEVTALVKALNQQ